MISELPQHQTAPHSSECERAVLGSVLAQGSLMDELPLRPEDFYEDRHQIIFRACEQLRDEQRQIDPRTLGAVLEGWGLLENVGGLAYLAGLDADLPDYSSAPFYASIVKERSTRRGAIQVAGEIIRAAHDGDREIRHELGTAATRLDALVQDRTSGEFVSMRRTADELGEYVEQDRVAVSGALTGIKAIDDKVVAMEPGQLWLIAARPGMGKTAMMLQSVEEALAAGRRVAIVSLEMQRMELQMRLVAKRGPISFAKIRRRSMSSMEHARFTYCQRELQHLPLWVDDTAGRTVQEIVAKVRALHRKEAIDEVWLDYLTLIDHPGGQRQDLEIDKIANKLAGLAKDLEIPVIALGQLGKRGEFEKRPPILADLKDAGEAPAYGVLLLHRACYDHNRSLLKPEGTITIAKNRGGELGEVPAWFDGATMTWRERDLTHDDPQ